MESKIKIKHQISKIKNQKSIKSNNKKTNQAEFSSEEEEEDGDEPVYEVERILAKKVEKGKVSFLLKWKGYPYEDSTWEPQEHLSCDELLRKFNLALQTKGGKRVFFLLFFFLNLDYWKNS